MQNGVKAGFPMESLKVRLLDGSYHSVDSDSLSFELAAKIAFRNACKKASTVLLEPIMKLEVVTPEEYMGDVSGDLNRSRGIINSVAARINLQVINAQVPLAEMFGYVTSLRTLTSGRATSTMEFSHFQEVPKNISDELIYKLFGVNFKQV